MSTGASHAQCLAKVSLGQPLPTTTTHRKHTFGKKRIPLRRRVVLHHVLRVQSQAGFGRGTVKIKEEEEIDVEIESEPSSGTKKFIKLPGTIKLPGAAKLQAKGQSQAKSNKVVFVAGATGKVGSRTIRELLKLGFQVRAGTRNVEKAQALFEDVTQSGPLATGSDDATPFGFFSPSKLFGFLKPKPGKVLEIVECDLEDAESIEPALGNAGVVVCCIGASEKEVLDVSGPYRIDFKATANLIDAASSAQVSHFVLLTSLGTQKFGFPAAVLNLFWGVLVWKAKAEKALLQSGLPYTIVRPGGMERPTDAYKETHNLLLGEADKLFGGQVSNLQVAELLASIVENPEVSVNKIIEAIAETTAPLRPIRELLEEISAKDETVSSPEPQRIRKTRPAKADVAPQKVSKRQEEENLAEEKRMKEKEEKRIQAEKLTAKAQKDKEEKRIRAENDEKEKLRLQALRKKYEEEIEAAREKEEAANSAATAALAEKADLQKRVAEIRAKAEAAALAASQAKAVEAAVVAAARKGNVLSDAEKEKIMESVKMARLPKEDGPKESKPSSKKKPAFSFFGKAAKTATDVESPNETKEDQAKVDAAKVKAEKEAAAKLAEQKKQEEKARKEEEAKKLAEQETAKALEAKQKAEQDKFEKEAKERAEKEAAEAKRKEEVEAKRKEELADAKKKEEQEKAEKDVERLKVEAEEKAKAKAEQEAEAKRKEEELAEAKKKEEQEKAEKEVERLKVEAEEKAKTKALAEQEAAAAAAAEAEKKAVQKEEEPEEAEEAPAPARRKGFRWFWQPAEPDTSEEEQITKADVAEVPVQAKVTEHLPPSSTPLSPYTRYPGLKPPCPPNASPPTAKAEKVDTPKIEPVSSAINRVEQTMEDVGLLAEKDKEVVVEELSPESQEDIEARARQVQETAAREREALEKAQAAISLKWLWEKTDPDEEYSASTTKQESVSSSKNEEPAPPVKEQVVAASKSDDLPRSSRPLSPYAQFPNLKPPPPPRASLFVPSIVAKEFKEVEPLPNSSTPLSPYAGFPDLKPPTSPTPPCNEVNGAVPENTEETEEKNAESAFSMGFKWPWQQ